jgi:hypothetical protein
MKSPLNFVSSALLLFLPALAWACTCAGTAPIEVAIASHPILVQGRVISLDQSESEAFGKLTHSATLRVSKVLKGSVSSNDITVVHVMCYASIYPANMEVDHDYVLPLASRSPEVPVEQGAAVALLAPEPGQYEMAGCAQSGLELVDGNLYAFQYDKGLQRRKEQYMSYATFRIWWPLAQAAVFSFAVIWGLHSEFGLAFLGISLVVGIVIAYFAARYRPWMLIAALVLVGMLCALNIGDLIARRIFVSQQGPVYWAFSWIAPVIIVGGGVFGYLVRRHRTRNFTP